MGRDPVTSHGISELCRRVAAESGFSGVVRVDLADGSTTEHAFGLADRRWKVPFTVGTRTSIASATKGFTAVAAMALIERGSLSLETTARSLLGTDLSLVDDDVTVEHLLAHRSGIGDYLDESSMADISDYAMPVPVHQLDSTASYLAILDGHRQVSAPGEEFAYNNGGFVLLALLMERATGQRFEQLIDELICRPAGLTETAFIRSDSLPPGVATGYLEAEGLLSNSLHMPVLGSGDGGLFSNTADIRRFWVAVFDDRLVSATTAKLMTSPHRDDTDHRYGLGFWLAPTGRRAILGGYDPGVSFRSSHDPATSQTYTVIGNTSEGAWPLFRSLVETLESS